MLQSQNDDHSFHLQIQINSNSIMQASPAIHRRVAIHSIHRPLDSEVTLLNSPAIHRNRVAILNPAINSQAAIRRPSSLAAIHMAALADNMARRIRKSKDSSSMMRASGRDSSRRFILFCW